MAHFSKRDPGSRSTPRPSEFRAPSPAPRARGATDGPDIFAVPAPVVAGAVSGSRSGPARHDELRICGLTAVRARFARDPESIQRLFFDYDTGRKVGVMSKVLAQAKKIYRCVEPAELEKVAGTVHHGGIVAVVKPAPLKVATAAEVQAWARRREPLVILDRVGNAHNLGAIARTMAFFGVPRLIIPTDVGAAKPNDAAYRVAEGGLEHMEVWTTPTLLKLVGELAAAGFDVVGAATRGGRPDAVKAGREAKPIALVFGNEEQGLAPDVAAACTRLVTIPGSGKVESLNVSVAAAVLLWELVARR
jgi:RNA methyltransferase, TrmH family